MEDVLKEYIVTVLSENQIGVLNRITAIYLRRKINVESLRVNESTIKGISMFIITAYASEDVIIKVTGQIKKIVEVLSADYYTSNELITQEVALYKISKSVVNMPALFEEISTNLSSRIVEMNGDYMVVTKNGSRESLEGLREKLQSAGVLEQFSSSGSVVLHRESPEDRLAEVLK